MMIIYSSSFYSNELKKEKNKKGKMKVERAKYLIFKSITTVATNPTKKNNEVKILFKLS